MVEMHFEEHGKWGRKREFHFCRIHPRLEFVARWQNSDHGSDCEEVLDFGGERQNTDEAKV